MIRNILILFFGLSLSSAAVAQDFGLAIGVHQTSASVDAPAGSTSTGSVSGRLGFDVGLLAQFEMVKMLHFRTGVLYDQRPFDYKVTNVGTFTYNYAYIDVPANVQYNFNEMFGVFGGLVVGVKASDNISTPGNVPTLNPSPSAKSMYPLLNAGVNFTFQDMFGFDLYYEQGLGSFSDDNQSGLGTAKNYSTFGLHFMYWL